MMKRYALTVALAAGLAGMTYAADQTGQGQSPQDQNQTTAGQSNSNAGQANQSGQPGAQPAGAEQSGAQQGQAESKQSTQDYVKMLASMNQYEIQAGQFVQQQAQDQQIKQYAQKMVEDHQKASEQLKPIAQAMGVDASSGTLDPVHQAKLAELQKKQGQDLEKCYIFGQAGGHLEDVLAAQWRAQNTDDQQLKQYLTQIEPKLRQHLQEAIQLSGGNMARTASERMHGSREGAGNVNGESNGAGSSGQTGSNGIGGSSSGGSSSGAGNQSGQSTGGSNNSGSGNQP